MAVIGRPNVGKSTAINAIVGEKVSIVSDKAQTTRFKIKAIFTSKEGQIIFVDTPGFHKPRDALGEYLNKSVISLLNEVDVIVFMVDAAGGVGRGDSFLAEVVAKSKPPKILALNKIDLCTKESLIKARSESEKLMDFASKVEMSALTRQGLSNLVESIFSLLKEGPHFYPEGELTDSTIETRIAEFIREKILQKTYEEVPHCVAVQIDEMLEKQEKGLVEIYATVFVERKSQKGIIIGNKGRTLKDIGTLARKDVEKILGRKVFLRIHVKVKEDWREKEALVRRFY